MQIRLTRDDVAAGDEPDERVVEADARTSLAQFLTSTGRTFLPTMYGGRATWIVRPGKRGKPVAVYAQEWGRVGIVRSANETVGSFDAIHFDYRAQSDPQTVLDELRPRA